MDSRRQQIKTFVEKKIGILKAESECGHGKAMLANLRHGVGHELGENPVIMGLVLPDMPEIFMSTDGNVTKEEWACYTALTLFSIHQQGYNIKSDCMHTGNKVSIGKGMSCLMGICGADSEIRILKRLQKFATSLDKKEAAMHLKGMISLLHSYGIPINYGMLAADLYDFQFDDSKMNVNLRWGQDFYRKEKQN